MKSDRGFTLLEILVVLAMCGLLLLAAPLVDRTLLDKVRLNFAVRNATAKIYQAELDARSGNSPVALGVSALRYESIEISLPGQTDIKQADRAIMLYPDGSATGAVLILHLGKRHRSLTINNLDGYVEQGE